MIAEGFGEGERPVQEPVLLRRRGGRIEKVFGTCKRSYGLCRMRWLGLAKAGLQVRLTVIAYNLRRSWRLLTPLLPA